MNKNREIKFIYIIVIAVFGIFLLLPIGSLLIQSFYNNGGLTLNNYLQTYQTTGFTIPKKMNILFNALFFNKIF